MSSESQVLVLRSNSGIRFCHGPPLEGEYNMFGGGESPICRDMKFEKNGSLFAWCTNQRVNVAHCSDYETFFKVDNAQVAALHLSPKGTYLSTWEPYSVKQNAKESCNLHIWNIDSGKCIKSFIQKKQNAWNPQWSDDEFICARNVSNEVHCFENTNFDTVVKKIFMQKVAHFSLAPGDPPYHIICFVPGVKGQPSFVRLFRYPNFQGADSVIAQKSFFKAEKTDFYWNKIGKDCIFLTSVDVDKSGASYYGELNLYYASVKGETAKIILGKEGPVYSVEWSPNNVEFCVVYGYMPAKATIYNLKCDPVFQFGSGPRNEVHYSPIGDRLTLSGFGNLQGQIEVWDLALKKEICKFQVRDSTLLQWSNDGEYILTATTSPRLRIGNGYRIWHYTGSLLQEIFCNLHEELYDILWKPEPQGKFQVKPTIYKPVPGIKSAAPEVSKIAYRPPGAQGKPASFKLHDDEQSTSIYKRVHIPPGAQEKPSSVKLNDNKQSTTSQSSSTALTKNQKRHLARKAKKQSENQIIPEPEVTSNSEIEIKRTYSSDPTGNPEKDKKIKSLLKKLDQIEKLKKEQAAGKSLQLSQLEKIKKANEFEEELAKLRLN